MAAGRGAERTTKTFPSCPISVSEVEIGNDLRPEAGAVLAQRPPASSLEEQTGGVHEHQVEPREQVAPMREQGADSSNTSFHAARGKRRAAVLLLLRQLLGQPSHRPIEMMQIEPLNAGDGVILAGC